MFGDWFERYGRWVASNRVIATAMLLTITLTAAGAIGARLAQGNPVDFTPQAMFMGEGEEWERLKEIEAEFGADDNDIVLSTGSEALDAVAFLKNADPLREALAMAPQDRILVETDAEVEPLAVAKILAKIAGEEDVDAAHLTAGCVLHLVGSHHNVIESIAVDTRDEPLLDRERDRLANVA